MPIHMNIYVNIYIYIYNKKAKGTLDFTSLTTSISSEFS